MPGSQHDLGRCLSRLRRPRSTSQVTEEPLDPNVPQRDDAAAMTDQSGGGVIASEGILGRDRELETVASLVSRAATGGGALLIRGDAGIGKAALLERAVALARAAGMQLTSSNATQRPVR